MKGETEIQVNIKITKWDGEKYHLNAETESRLELPFSASKGEIEQGLELLLGSSSRAHANNLKEAAVTAPTE